MGGRLLPRPTAMLACTQRDRARNADQIPRQRGPCAVQRQPRTTEGGAMEPPPTGQEAIGHDESAVHTSRVSRLARLGVPGPLARIYADRIDWLQVAQRV